MRHAGRSDYQLCLPTNTHLSPLCHLSLFLWHLPLHLPFTVCGDNKPTRAHLLPQTHPPFAYFLPQSLLPPGCHGEKCVEHAVHLRAVLLFPVGWTGLGDGRTPPLMRSAQGSDPASGDQPSAVSSCHRSLSPGWVGPVCASTGNSQGGGRAE